MRTFLAVEIPRQIRKKINNFIEEEKSKGLPIKWVKFENLHITLKFLGEIDENKKEEITPAIKELCKKYVRFNMNLQGLGCFPHPGNPRVLWIGVKLGHELLIDIAGELEEKLSQFGFKMEKRFHGHLTIGRIKKFCKVDDILTKTYKSEVFPVTAITLFKSALTSQGPIYEALEKFNLG
ncbi:MAG: RNA 2',3'-cyclic phosphodiesterase [bacterium]